MIDLPGSWYLALGATLGIALLAAKYAPKRWTKPVAIIATVQALVVEIPIIAALGIYAFIPMITLAVYLLSAWSMATWLRYATLLFPPLFAAACAAFKSALRMHMPGLAARSYTPFEDFVTGYATSFLIWPILFALLSAGSLIIQEMRKKSQN